MIARRVQLGHVHVRIPTPARVLLALAVEARHLALESLTPTGRMFTRAGAAGAMAAATCMAAASVTVRILERRA